MIIWVRSLEDSWNHARFIEAAVHNGFEKIIYEHFGKFLGDHLLYSLFQVFCRLTALSCTDFFSLKIYFSSQLWIAYSSETLVEHEYSIWSALFAWGHDGDNV